MVIDNGPRYVWELSAHSEFLDSKWSGLGIISRVRTLIKQLCLTLNSYSGPGV